MKLKIILQLLTIARNSTKTKNFFPIFIPLWRSFGDIKGFLLVRMKLTAKQIIDLTTPDGGEFGVSSVGNGFDFCKKLAGHYENFPVGSVLIPAKFRNNFFAVYAFARLGDDIADELSEIGKANQLAALDRMESLILDFSTEISDNKKQNPIFLALHFVLSQKIIPALPFQKLLNAFRSDILFVQAQDFSKVEAYCQNSANPVGELVLRIFDLYNSQTAPFSDAICTGLQLANFWQDISVDSKHGRIYIPQDLLKKYKLQTDDLLSGKFSPIFRKNFKYCLSELGEITQSYFNRGKNLLPHLPSLRLRLEIAVILQSGLAILNKSLKLEDKLLDKRPKLTKSDYFLIGLRALSSVLQEV